jgi:hypothetical protein
MQYLRPSLGSRLASPLALALTAVLALAFAGEAHAGKAKKKKKASASTTASSETAPEFDKSAAQSALAGVDVTACKKSDGPTGEGHVVVTFSPAGGASAAYADTAPFAGTQVGRCVEGQYKRARIPAFRGDAVNVGKKFRLE